MLLEKLRNYLKNHMGQKKGYIKKLKKEQSTYIKLFFIQHSFNVLSRGFINSVNIYRTEPQDTSIDHTAVSSRVSNLSGLKQGSYCSFTLFPCLLQIITFKRQLPLHSVTNIGVASFISAFCSHFKTWLRYVYL